MLADHLYWPHGNFLHVCEQTTYVDELIRKPCGVHEAKSASSLDVLSVTAV